MTPNSISTQTALMAEVHLIRRQGFAIDNQENEMDGRCVTVRIPLFE